MRIPLKTERLQQLVILSEINLYHFDAEFHLKDQYIFYDNEKEKQGICEDELHALLQEDLSVAPVIYERDNGELVGIIRENGDSFYLTSPVPGDYVVKILAFLEIVDMVLMNRITYQKDILIKENVHYNEQENKVQNLIESDMIQKVHYSFYEEQEFTQAIEQGDKEKVYEFLEKGFIQTFSKTSEDSMVHYRNLCITAITLASRAAIRGGVPTAMAYDFSNTVMKQAEKIHSVSQMYTLICGVFNRYTQMVIEEKKTGVSNSLVEQCKQYVIAHYKEKITVNDIADYLGRNPNYISTVFKEKMGISLKYYINKEKIDAAKDMLKYSDFNVLAISNFLSFNSQAYFGKIFKEITGTTPKKYRDENRVKELTWEN